MSKKTKKSKNLKAQDNPVLDNAKENLTKEELKNIKKKDRFKEGKKHGKGKIATIIASLLVVVLLLMTIFTPYPVAFGTKIALSFKNHSVDDDFLKEVNAYTDQTKNISYNSKYSNGKMDIYHPIDNDEKLPLIIWIHGGFYVGGDKKDPEVFCRAIAKDGYAVAVMNYATAPFGKYPQPLYQIAEAYEFLNENQDKYNVDTSKIFLAGDSTGAQIAGQFALTQTSRSYSNVTGIKQIIPKENIFGTLLYCGYFDSDMLLDESAGFDNFLIKRYGWSYFGEKNWADTSEVKNASFISQITSDYPPTFITDANNDSFIKHGEHFRDVLMEKRVKVSTLFFTTENDTSHQYQFSLNTDEGKQALSQTHSFILRQIHENQSG